ncbi:hypothetical protein [Synechococcus sp. PCC 7335]|uniref:hypothetical protein n=1 Tax=Synechococcus sp. (strain ATCC 29403 / PCC 7335) TaxID=91464 RepID=UPI00056E0BA9|nr:hypothetical protein [Synechococcus sp. PCC 7335]
MAFNRTFISSPLGKFMKSQYNKFFPSVRDNIINQGHRIHQISGFPAEVIRQVQTQLEQQIATRRFYLQLFFGRTIVLFVMVPLIFLWVLNAEILKIELPSGLKAISLIALGGDLSSENSAGS